MITVQLGKVRFYVGCPRRRLEGRPRLLQAASWGALYSPRMLLWFLCVSPERPKDTLRSPFLIIFVLCV